MKKSPDQFVDQRKFAPMSSSQHLTREQVDTYNRDGYLIVRKFFDRAAIDSVRSDVMRLFEPETKVWHSGPELVSDAVKRTLLGGKMPQLVADVNGGPSNILLSFIIRKIAGDARIKPWHQDGVYWGGTGQEVFATFVPLTKYDNTHGPLYVIPGSHKLGRIYHEWIEDPKYIPNSLVCDVKPFNDPVLVEAEPGDLVICHSLTVHASFDNAGIENRYTLGCHWRLRNADVQVDETIHSVYGSGMVRFVQSLLGLFKRNGRESA